MLHARSRTSEQSFVSVHRVYFVSIDILIQICELQYTRKRRLFEIQYLYELFVGGGVEYQRRRIFRLRVGLKREQGTEQVGQ
jgi:hypothetical protein